MKKALITGIMGQDGAYLTELLLSKGYEVHGMKQRTSPINAQGIVHLIDNPHETGAKMIHHYGDLSDSTNIIRIIQLVQPDEIYNLGAMSHVQGSFEEPEYVANTDAAGALRILEAVRILDMAKTARIYQASTSQLYGKSLTLPQNEKTPFYPRSPYSVAKLYAFWITANYRESYGMFACNGILFNHESPLGEETLVTRKISRGVADIVMGLKKKLWLGNLDAKRDWGHAKDYVEAMWLMLQQPEPDDFVIATGVSTSVRDFVKLAFVHAGVNIEFERRGKNERAVVVNVSIPDIPLRNGDVVVEVDSRYFRATEVDILQGDASKARQKLGWYPKYSLDDLVKEMIEFDIEYSRKNALLKDSGYRTITQFQ